MKRLSRIGRKPKPVDDKAINIAVADDTIELRYNRTIYSKVKRNSIQTGLYWDYMTPAAFVKKDPRILLIGLGGGTIPMQLANYLRGAYSLDIVEVSGHMIGMAKDFMSRARAFADFEAPDLSHVIVGDGFDYLVNADKTYDVIMLDAYVGDTIPSEFLTSDFVDAAASRLSENSVLAINYAMSFMQTVQYHRYVSELKRRFSVYQIGDRFISGNIILICLKGTLGKPQVLSSIKSVLEGRAGTDNVISGYDSMKLL